MTDENISIVIQDEVATSIGTKLDAISAKALAGAKAIEQLQGALKRLDGGSSNVKSSVSQSELNKAALAQQKLATETQKTTAAHAKAAIEASRALVAYKAINTEALKGQLAQQKLATETNKTSQQATRAALAQQQLATATQRTNSATAQAAQAQIQAQAALQRLSNLQQQASQRATAAALQASRSQQLLATAQQRTAVVAGQAAVAQQNLGTAQNRTAASAAQAAAAQSRAATAAIRLQQAQARATASSTQFAGSLSGLAKSALAAAGVSLGAERIVQSADAYTVLENKLKNVTTGQEQLNFTTKAMFQIANETRTGVLETAQAYQRFELALRSLGRGQEDSLRLTKTINTLLLTSGATTGEAAAGLLQLSQAFNKGKLDGDEFRTVMELMPAAADAIAKALNVTRGELLELAPTGVITSKVMFEAFDALAEQMDGRLADSTLTVGQSFVVMKNKAIEVFGEFNKSTGIMTAVASLILGVANNIGVLSVALVAITAVITAQFIPAMVRMSAVFLASPIGLAVAAVTALTAAYIALRPETDAAKNSQAGMAQELRKSNDELERLERIKSTQGKRGSAFEEAGVQQTRAGVIKTGTDAELERALSRNNKLKEKPFSANTFGNTPDLIEQAKIDFATQQEYNEKMQDEKRKSSQKATEELERQIKKADKLTRDDYADRIFQEQEFQKAIALLKSKGLIDEKEAKRRTALQELKTGAQDLPEVQVTNVERIPRSDALADYNIEVERYLKLLSLTAKEREISIRQDQVELEIRSRKGDVTDAEIEGARSRVALIYSEEQAAQARDQAYANGAGAREQFIIQLKAITDLEGKLGQNSSDTILAYNDMFGGLLEGTVEYTNAVVQQYKFMYEQIENMALSDASKRQLQTKIEQKEWDAKYKDKIEKTSQFFGGFAALMNSHSKKQFEIGKKAALAEAVISGYVTILNAYRSGGNFYVGAALAIAAAAQVSAQISAIKSTQYQGYMKGGYTGDVARDAIAGVVHGQEYVFDAASTARIGASNLEAMRQGASTVSTSASVGTSAGFTGDVSVIVNNLGTPQKYEVESVTRDEIRLIARDEATKTVSKETPKIVSGQLSQPNSEISKSFAGNFESQRKR